LILHRGLAKNSTGQEDSAGRKQPPRPSAGRSGLYTLSVHKPSACGPEPSGLRPPKGFGPQAGDGSAGKGPARLMKMPVANRPLHQGSRCDNPVCVSFRGVRRRKKRARGSGLKSDKMSLAAPCDKCLSSGRTTQARNSCINERRTHKCSRLLAEESNVRQVQVQEEGCSLRLLTLDSSTPKKTSR
jgi:hypothetical protein